MQFLTDYTMSKYRRVPKELKEKILDWVKNDGISVRQASQEYWISEQSIHKWLRDESEDTGFWMHNQAEIRRLKKDKEDLLLLVWALTAELDKAKKKKSR